MDSCDSHGRSCSSQSERWKEQSEMNGHPFCFKCTEYLWEYYIYISEGYI